MRKVNFKEIRWRGLDYIHTVHDIYVTGVGHSEQASGNSGLISFKAENNQLLNMVSSSQFGEGRRKRK